MQQITQALKEQLHRNMQTAMSDHSGGAIWTGMKAHVDEVQALPRLMQHTTGFMQGNLPSPQFKVNKYAGRAMVHGFTLYLGNPLLSRCVADVELPERRFKATLSVVDLVALLDLGPL